MTAEGDGQTLAHRSEGRLQRQRTAPFTAKGRGLCERLGMFINRGDEVRFHKDFVGVVHSGCRAPEVTVVKVEETAVFTGTREPTVCPDCHLEHAGPCW